MSKVEQMTMHTEHFTASIDRKNRTFTIYGDFSQTVVHQIPDNPYGGEILGDIIEELRDLETDIRLMVGLKEVTYDLTQISDSGGKSAQ